MCHVSERDVSADRSHIFQQIHAKKKKKIRRRRCGSSRCVIGRTVCAAGSQSSEMWDGVTSCQKNATLTILVSGALFLFYFTFLAHATCSYFGAAPLRLLRPLGSLRLVTRHIVHFIFGSVLALSCLALFFILFFHYYFFRDRESARMWAAVRHDHESGKWKIKLMLGSVKKLGEDTQLGPVCVAAGATSLE